MKYILSCYHSNNSTAEVSLIESLCFPISFKKQWWNFVTFVEMKIVRVYHNLARPCDHSYTSPHAIPPAGHSLLESGISSNLQPFSKKLIQYQIVRKSSMKIFTKAYLPELGRKCKVSAGISTAATLFVSGPFLPKGDICTFKKMNSRYSLLPIKSNRWNVPDFFYYSLSSMRPLNHCHDKKKWIIG